ncbi:dephospho-CoA kinase domain-containing protein isoform X5 [Egretta garzetta]|uniref:dephospho-CoA kinase domain-containing protein isoform X5 n=1 Tax=Egretta garzetta TaxID=188379 RepID=UPI00163CA658|nr:dephospho-CoA kinase domain-containing protein isoform X5 [Egretta garzetta]
MQEEGCGAELMPAGCFDLLGVSPQRDLGPRGLGCFGVFLVFFFLQMLSCSTDARCLPGCSAEPRRSRFSGCWQADVLPAEKNKLGYLMNKTHLRPIADANTNCAVELALTSGCLMLSVVQPHFKAYRQIVHYFGTEILLENGEINREALGNIIFSHPGKRQLLNSITHPEIQKEMLKQILKYFVLGYRYVILDIPLLFETNRLTKFMKCTVLVYCAALPSQQ